MVGGRSAGARVACRTAADTGAVAVLCLAFPVHAPGRPEKTREHELDAVELPVLVVQGESDPFGMPADGANRRVVDGGGQPQPEGRPRRRAERRCEPGYGRAICRRNGSRFFTNAFLGAAEFGSLCA